MLKRRRSWTIAGVILAVLCLTLLLILSLVDEPLRAYLERTANARLQNYEVKIGELDLRLFAGAVKLNEVSLRHRDHPDPPLASIERWTAGIHWRDVLFGRLVSEHRITRPTLAIMRPEARDDAAHAFEETKDVVEEPGWQDAVYALFPITINEFVVEDADVTYRDDAHSDPLHLSHVDVKASNIRNVRTPDRQYPSELMVKAQVFDTGRLELNGRADFLAQPHPAVECDVEVKDVPLDKLRPLAGRYNVQLQRGAVTASGHIEYAPWAKQVRLNEMLVERMHVDYVHSSKTAKKEEAVASQVKEKAKDVHRDPELLIKVDHAKILDSEVGFVNKASSPDYRVFIADMNLEVDNFSNRLKEGTGVVKITGQFMGSGPTTVTGSFRPEKPRPDFDLEVRIVKTKVQALNNLLRAYGDVDTTTGTFAFFCELRVKDNRIDGYVKPFLKDIEVYDPKQDKDKALSKKVYQAVVDGVLGLFENRPRDEVATKTDLSGPVENPEASTWQIVAKLVENAFFKAILPGFEGHIG